MPDGLLLGAAVSGWIVAAGALGLWWGERGRRLDAHRREDGRPISMEPPKRATVKSESKSALPEATERELEPPHRFIRETMAETGCTEEHARDEWFKLLGQAHMDVGSGWDPEL